jgi:putative membrane protein
MTEESLKKSQSPSTSRSDLSRDHLANERTFLAWIRTGIAFVVFGFAIGRFAVAIRQWMVMQGPGHVVPTVGLSVWFGTVAIAAGVLVCLMGLARYKRARLQIEAGNFEPAGFIVDLVGILTALFGVGLAVYLIYIELHF